MPQRVLLVAGTFALSVLLYVDRTCISAAKDAVTGEFQLTDEHWAWVLASFAFGYALFQTPGGMLADRLGGRLVLTTVVVVWSLFTGLTATATGLTSLLIIRFLFGAGEAGAFPGIAQVVYSWIPLNERGIVKGINFSGARVGAALAMPLIAAMIKSLSWKPTFAILMGVGFVWAISWCWWFRDDPAKHGSVTAKELEYILAHRQQPAPSVNSKSATLSFGRMIGSRNLWLLMGQYFGSNFTFFFSLTWLYPYVKSKYSLDAVDAGWYAMMPLLAGAAGNIFSGWLVDRLFRSGAGVWSRRLPAMAGFAMAAAGMLLSVDQSTASGATLWLSIAIFGADMTITPSWACCVDIGGRHAGAVSGTMNMAGNLGSAITALAFAYLPKSSQGNVSFFYTAAILSIASLVCWCFVRNEELFIVEEPHSREK